MLKILIDVPDGEFCVEIDDKCWLLQEDENYDNQYHCARFTTYNYLPMKKGYPIKCPACKQAIKDYKGGFMNHEYCKNKKGCKDYIEAYDDGVASAFFVIKCWCCEYYIREVHNAKV